MIAPLDRYRHNRNLLQVRDNHLGKGVYAACRFAEGAELARFKRRSVLTDRPEPIDRTPARWLHEFTRRGHVADLVNHSCDPNAGLRFTTSSVALVAIRDIFCGDEISWDYSTACVRPDWRMLCQCGSAQCRRIIGDFGTLDPQRQEYFRARNLVAPDLRRRDTIGPTHRAAPD